MLRIGKSITHSFHSDASQMEAKPLVIKDKIRWYQFPFRRFTDGSKVLLVHPAFSLVAIVSIQTLHRWKQSGVGQASGSFLPQFPFRRFTDGSKVVDPQTQNLLEKGFHSDASQMEAKCGYVGFNPEVDSTFPFRRFTDGSKA